MHIQKVYGLHATDITLSERFTMLTPVADVGMGPKKQQFSSTVRAFLEQTMNFEDRAFIIQIARILQQQARMRAHRQRLGRLQVPGLQRYSGNTMLELQQPNGNINNTSYRNQNQNRGAKLKNLSRIARRGTKQAGQKLLQWNAQGARGPRRGVGRQGTTRPIGLAAARMTRLRAVPTRAALDRQLERYMALAPAALDRQLDRYMAQAPAALDRELDRYMAQQPAPQPDPQPDLHSDLHSLPDD